MDTDGPGMDYVQIQRRSSQFSRSKCQRAGNHESFLGILNFLGRFSSKFSKLSVLLKNISNVRYPCQPTPKAAQCFQVILGKDIKLPYFSIQKQTTLQTNVSIKGLRAVLIQDGVPVYFVSRTFTPAKKNYQNPAHDTLATFWGMECFSHIIFSEEFTLETNQKPLLRIFEKKIDDIFPRIIKHIYHSFIFRPFKVVYLKGKKNCYADALSRVSTIASKEGRGRHRHHHGQ